MHITQRNNMARGLVAFGLLMLSNAAVAQFAPLFTVGKGSGAFFIKRPTCEYEAGVANHAYPYGSEISVQKGSKIFVFLSSGRQIHFGGDTVFTLMNDPDVENGKRIVLTSGTMETLLAIDEESVYPLSVETKAAFYDDFDGRIRIGAASDANGSRTSVQVIMGKVSLKAPQVETTRLSTGASLSIATETDASYTEMEGLAGDFSVLLAHGSAPAFEAKFNKGSRAKIWRKWAPLTKKLTVSVMLADANGAVHNNAYAFIDGQAPVQNGVAQETVEAEGEEASGEEAASSDAGDGALDDFSSDFSSDFGDADAAPGADTNASDEFSSFDDFSF